MRRAPVEDNRQRGDIRPDMSKRLDNYVDKPREMERYRDDGSFGGRDNPNRQKDRLAPARPGPGNIRQHPNMGHQNQQMTPDRERERPGNDRPGPGNMNRFETRNRPLLQLPHSTPPMDQQKMPYRGGPEERVLR